MVTSAFWMSVAGSASSTRCTATDHTSDATTQNLKLRDRTRHPGVDVVIAIEDQPLVRHAGSAQHPPTAGSERGRRTETDRVPGAELLRDPADDRAADGGA